MRRAFIIFNPLPFNWRRVEDDVFRFQMCMPRQPEYSAEIKCACSSGFSPDRIRLKLLAVDTGHRRNTVDKSAINVACRSGAVLPGLSGATFTTCIYSQKEQQNKAVGDPHYARSRPFLLATEPVAESSANYIRMIFGQNTQPQTQ